jgi:hypothetical protein
MNIFRKPPYTPDDPEYDHPPPRWAVEAGLRAAKDLISCAEETDYRPELAALESARIEATIPSYKAMMDRLRAAAAKVIRKTETGKITGTRK